MKRTFSHNTPFGPLHGSLSLPDPPDRPRGLILLARAHHAPVDALITANLAARHFAVFNMELLSAQESRFADATQNVPKLTERLLDLLDILRHDGDTESLPLAIFASGDAAPAALRAAAQRDTQVKVLACHGGLIDRAGLQALTILAAPLCMVLDAGDSAGKLAADRAFPHLRVAHECHVLHAGEDPVLHIAAWLSLHLAS